MCYFVETDEARWQGERHLLHLKTLPESYRDEICPTRAKAQLVRLINDIRGNRQKKVPKEHINEKKEKRLQKLLVYIAIRK